MSVGKEQSKKLNIVISSGSGTGTIAQEWSLARWMRVKPVDETDTYSLALKDNDGVLIVSREFVTGTFSERLEISLGTLKTVVITSASQDGTYTFYADLH